MKIQGNGAGEMAQQSIALAAFKKDLGSIPRHLHCGSQPSIAAVPGDPTPSSALRGHQLCTQYTFILADKTFIHTK